HFEKSKFSLILEVHGKPLCGLSRGMAIATKTPHTPTFRTPVLFGEIPKVAESWGLNRKFSKSKFSLIFEVHGKPLCGLSRGMAIATKTPHTPTFRTPVLCGEIPKVAESRGLNRKFSKSKFSLIFEVHGKPLCGLSRGMAIATKTPHTPTFRTSVLFGEIPKVAESRR